MSLKPILVGGAIGGVLPTLAKLASTYVATPSTPPPQLGLLIGLALFGIIGAAIAVATKQTDIQQALIAGIAAPGIITNLLAGAAQSGPQSAPPTPAVHGSILDFVGTAFAQGSVTADTIAGVRQITIDPKVAGGLPNTANIAVTGKVTGQDNKKSSIKLGTINSLSEPTTITVPSSIDQIQIGGTTVPLSGPHTTIQLDVATKPTSGSDFFWALGAPRTYQIDAVSPKVR